jgi:hypothetical protein
VRCLFLVIISIFVKIFTAVAHRGPARQVAGCLAAPLSQLNQRFLEKSLAKTCWAGCLLSRTPRWACLIGNPCPPKLQRRRIVAKHDIAARCIHRLDQAGVSPG